MYNGHISGQSPRITHSYPQLCNNRHRTLGGVVVGGYLELELELKLKLELKLELDHGSTTPRSH